MANNIFKYKGINIGNSIYEKNIGNIIEEIFSYAENNKCKIFFLKMLRLEKN